jgi:hypothetical protein
MSTSSLGIGVADSKLETQLDSLSEQFAGSMLAAEGRVTFWKLLLDARFFGGELENRRGDAATELLIGEAMLGIRVVPWLAVKSGLRIRSLKTDSRKDTWYFWEALLHAEAPLLAPWLYSYVEVYFDLAADVGDSHALDRGQGAEAGVVLRAGPIPLWVRFGYRIDHAEFEGQVSEETVQHAFLTLGIDPGAFRRGTTP